MPFVNVIHGQTLPDAPLNVRTPIIRIPLWAALSWWCVKALARALVYACIYWYATVPAAILLAAYARYGWVGPVTIVDVVAVSLAVWAFWHRPSFRRFVWL